MIYINKDIQNIYVDLTFELDANYEQGNSLDDFKAGKWIKLSDAQIAFRNVNPSASVREVLSMQLDQVVSSDQTDNALDNARWNKLQEIEQQDNLSNKFFVSVLSGGVEVANVQLWVDKDLRNSLLNSTLPALKSDGETTTKLWSNTTPPQSIEVPIDWALEKLPLLEIYAKRTYDLYCSNTAAVYAATTVEAINAIDVTANFPLFLTFELNT